MRISGVDWDLKEFYDVPVSRNWYKTVSKLNQKVSAYNPFHFSFTVPLKKWVFDTNSDFIIYLPFLPMSSTLDISNYPFNQIKYRRFELSTVYAIKSRR